MRSLSIVLALAILLGLAQSTPALAYFGPGAGITMLGALWGVLLAIILAAGAVLAWPIRAMLRRRKAASMKAEPMTGGESRH
jgi:hypothetical protein